MMKKPIENLSRKNVLLDTKKLKQLQQKLNVSSESEAIRLAIDNLLFEDEVMSALGSLRRRGTVVDAHRRVTR